jgi:hypothetical protein
MGKRHWDNSATRESFPAMVYWRSSGGAGLSMAPPAHTGSLALLACCGFSLFVAVREQIAVDRGVSKLGARGTAPTTAQIIQAVLTMRSLTTTRANDTVITRTKNFAVSCALRFLLQQGALLAASYVVIRHRMPLVVTAPLSDRQNCRVTFRDKFQQLLIYAS